LFIKLKDSFLTKPLRAGTGNREQGTEIKKNKNIFLQRAAQEKIRLLHIP